MTNPVISFITPTFRRPHLLRQAIASLLAQTDPRWEIVISPDDGQKYTHLTALDPRIRIVDTAARQTGPSAARNRALLAARGDHIAALDDDDTVAPNFVESVMKALKTAKVVTVPTRYLLRTGQVIREIGSDVTRLGIHDFGRLLGSMPVICRRELVPQWQHCIAEDVVHTCEAIDLAGGEIPVVNTTRYCCIVHPDSITTTLHHFGDEYQKIINTRTGNLTATGADEMRELFEFRIKINAAFEARPRGDIGYHEFVQSIETEAF